MCYFPVSAILGETKVNFSVNEVRTYLINGDLPNIALGLALLNVFNNLVDVSIVLEKAKSLS